MNTDDSSNLSIGFNALRLDYPPVKCEDASLNAADSALRMMLSPKPIGTPESSRPFQNPRKLSILSNTVPACLKGICYVFKFSNGNACVGRLTNCKVDHLQAMRYITKAHEAKFGQDNTDDPDLETCLTGFHDYAWDRFCSLIPLEIDEGLYSNLYHDSRICALTRKCPFPDCKEVL